VNDFAEFPLVQVDKVLIAKAMQRHRNREFSFWDSLVIEAALQANCDTLLSEDMQDGRIIHGLTIANPFKLKDKN
jgi:predicted nucleic acid-binding protein